MVNKDFQWILNNHYLGGLGGHDPQNTIFGAQWPLKYAKGKIGLIYTIRTRKVELVVTRLRSVSALPEFTGRVHGPSWRPVNSGAFLTPVNSGSVNRTPVYTGRVHGRHRNRPLDPSDFLVLPTMKVRHAPEKKNTDSWIFCKCSYMQSLHSVLFLYLRTYTFIFPSVK